MSRLIKSGWTSLDQKENKVISIRRFKEEGLESKTSPDSHFPLREKEDLIQQAEYDAQKILEEAKLYAQSLEEQLNKEKSSWQKEKEQLINQTKESAYKEGFVAGKQKGYNEASEIIKNAKQIVEDSKRDYRNKIEASEQTILNLGLKVAEKIIGEHIDGNPEHFLPVVKRALKEAREYREIQLHVNPSYYDFLLAQKEDLIRMFPKETELYIYPDGDLAVDSCIIESANGRIDASIDQQLEVIKDKLFELLESE